MLRIPKVILLVESSRASGRAFLRGVATYAHHHGPWSVFWEPAGLEEAWSRLIQLDADGIIMRDISHLEQALSFGISTVILGHHRKEVAGLVNVVTDSRNIARFAAEHLLHCGF